MVEKIRKIVEKNKKTTDLENLEDLEKWWIWKIRKIQFRQTLPAPQKQFRKNSRGKQTNFPQYEQTKEFGEIQEIGKYIKQQNFRYS